MPKMTSLLSPHPRVWVRAQTLGRSATRRVYHRLDDSLPECRRATIAPEVSGQGGARSDVLLYSIGAPGTPERAASTKSLVRDLARASRCLLYTSPSPRD